MSKKNFVKKIYGVQSEESGNSSLRRKFFLDRMSYYYNIFMNRYDFPELETDEKIYLLRSIWDVGQTVAFALIDPKKYKFVTNAEIFSNGLLGFAPATPTNYNMYNRPTRFILINERGVPYIPSKPLVNHENCVLCYANYDLMPIRSIIETKVRKIVEDEMTIRTQLMAQKLSAVIESDIDGIQDAKSLKNDLANDVDFPIVKVKETDKIKSLSPEGLQFNIQTIYNHIKSVEGEIQTYLGIDNMDYEKAERLGSDEANANNEIINESGDCIFDNMKSFCEEITDRLGIKLTVRYKHEKASSIHDPEPSKASGPQTEGEPE